MRLIDADALMAEFAEFVRPANNSDFAPVPTWNDAVSLLGSAPTIEIVRCGECKFFVDEGMYCEQNIITQFDHFYCYYGERRADDETN